MKDLVDIARELKDSIGKKVILNGVEGKIHYAAVFASTLYEVKKGEGDNIIIEFNEHFKALIINDEDTEEYKKAKEFADKNNYTLQLKKYNMTPPKPRSGVLY